MYQNIFGVKMCNNVYVWCLYTVCLILTVTTKGSGANFINSPSKDFSRHSVVQPTVHHARTKREISTTREKTGAHHSDVIVRIQIDGEEYVLDLRLNEDLVAGDHIIQYQKNGKKVVHKPKKEDLDLCQYSGTVRGKPDSWAAVSTCRGLRGVIFDGVKMRYIQPVQGNDIQSDHYVFDHSDLTSSQRCGYEGVTKNASYDPLLMKKYLAQKSREQSRPARYKRQTDDTQVRGPFNENKLSRYVELVLVSDYREFRANGESFETVHHQLKDVANIINSVYAPLNIFIALVGVVVWNERDEIQIMDDGDSTLTNFLGYRRTTLLADIPNDNAHLITGQKFKDGVVGKALKGPICTFEFSGGVATNHSSVIGLVATTIAHEMGHNFGMEHDTEQDCECADERCIMSPSSTAVVPVHWSSCSLKSLALAFERGMDYCLRNKPKRLFDSPTCGNGFVEPGEQCDCGLTIAGQPSPCHACCDPRACMLRPNATCAAGTCCDLKTCRPKSAGTVCRSADRECDLPEYCTGHSEFCPPDVFKMDSMPCGNEQAYCVRGSCRTHTDQCRLLWGTTGESSSDQCYQHNAKGTKNGNCGYVRSKQMYVPCGEADARCGLLQCRHLNERLEFGVESVAHLSALFINNNGTIIPCRTAIIDLGLSDVDPGMVPDGAKCGEDKMCLNHKCVSVESVRAAITRRDSSVCPSNCSGHGVCNSEGHCHCEAGFAPPLCKLPGPGGSLDSGPATDPSVQRNFMVAMYIIFLGIIPSVLLVLFLVYYSRHNVLFRWKKPRKSYVHSALCPGRDATPTFKLPKLTSLRNLIPTKKNKIDNSKLELDEPTDKQNPVCIVDMNKYKKTFKKINKDDIVIATPDAKVELESKPSEVKSKVTIVNAGLASTTNELITNKNNRSRLHSISSENVEKLNKEQPNQSKQPIYYKILHLTDKNQNNKNYKKLHLDIKKNDPNAANDKPKVPSKPSTKPKPSQIKPNVTIVKADLTSTTNGMLANKLRLHNIKS